MKMAIKKMYFRFNLKDNMEFYLKNTKKWPPWWPAFSTGSRRSTTTWKPLHCN